MAEQLVHPQPDDFDETDRREQVALDQGIHNPFLAHLDDPLDHWADGSSGPAGRSDYHPSSYRPFKPHRQRPSIGVERGTPSGADVARQIMNEEGPYIPPTPEERLHHMDMAEDVRLGLRRALAAERYDRLLNSCRREDGTLDETLLAAKMRVHEEREAERKSARQILRDRIAGDIV